MPEFSHVTLRLARYPEPVSLPDLGPLVEDEAGSLWLLGSDDMASRQHIGSRTAEVWAVLGLHTGDAGDAGTLGAAGPYGEALAGAAATWDGVLAPYSHRGETNWHDGPLFAPGNRRSQEGPFVVITTVGFDPALDTDGTRVRDFIRGVAEVRAAFGTSGTVQAQHAFWFGRTWLDPFTLTFWGSDDLLRPEVYDEGAHRRRMDDYHRNGTADRTSFTRLRVLRSEGSWSPALLP